MPYILSSLSDVLIGIVVVLVLSASMSTLSALVLTSSSTITLDLIKDNLYKDMNSEKTTKNYENIYSVFYSGFSSSCFIST